MAQHFSDADILEIVRLKEVENLTHRQIAERMGRLDKDGKPNERSVMAQYTKFKKGTGQVLTAADGKVQDAPKKNVAPSTHSTVLNKGGMQPDLNELTRKQRVDYLKQKLPASARGKHIFNNVLTADEQELFLEEYYTVISEEDSLTSAEEQQLFNATLHLVLAWRAMAQDKECYNKSPLSGYKGPDITVYVDTFKKDAEANMKKYGELIKSLKLSREQRLKDLQRQGTTFLDFAEKYAKHDEQYLAVQEILKLEELSAAELRRLQANGWLVAGGLPNNQVPNFGPPIEVPGSGEIS